MALLKKKREYRAKIQAEWIEGVVKGAPTKAEELIINKILSSLSYTNIYRPTKNFYFDALCKKDKKLFAVEITTSRKKTSKKHRKEFLQYLDIPLLLFFVKPNLKEYWLLKVDKVNSSSFEYKQGRRCEVKV